MTKRIEFWLDESGYTAVWLAHSVDAHGNMIGLPVWWGSRESADYVKSELEGWNPGCDVRQVFP